MAGFGAGKTSALVFGGVGILALLFLAVAATIVLSLIPIYTADRSKEGYGEEYSYSAVMLKSLVSVPNPPGLNTIPATVTITDNDDLSDLCAMQVKNQHAMNVAGCILQNGNGLVTGNTSTSSRRRRQATQYGMYSVHELRFFYNSVCQKETDKGKTDASPNLSVCVAKRLAYINNLVNNYSTSFREWTPSPSFRISVMTGPYQNPPTPNNYGTWTVDRVFGISRTTAPIIASGFIIISSTTTDHLKVGAKCVGTKSLPEINAILAAHAVKAGSAPTTDQPVG